MSDYDYKDSAEVWQWQDIVAIKAGFFHIVGLKADGTVVASGENELGQCNVSEWKDIVAIAAGGMYTAAMKKDGTVLVTGRSNYTTGTKGWVLWQP
jgi:alpha-tubulin suppressor-like RCC1 family protein